VRMKRVAEAQRIETPNAEAFWRMDRKRKKKTSNEDWKDSHLTPMPRKLPTARCPWKAWRRVLCAELDRGHPA
jgi:hypothetical protein